MEELRRYLISVVAASLVCGIVLVMFPGSGTSAKLTKLITGILLTLTVLYPVIRFDAEKYFDQWTGQFPDGKLATETGENLAKDAMAKIIKDNCEAYILDKAISLGLDVSVVVSVSNESIPRPNGVVILGQAAPYARQRLQAIIENDLGIAKEDQKWNS